MSFRAREIMIGVLPARALRRGAPGFALCGEATRNEDEDDLGCDEATRPGPPPAYCAAADLAALKQQLRQAMGTSA
jgi:hypothetical protein